MLVLLLHVDWNWMEMVEFETLMRGCVLMIDFVVDIGILNFSMTVFLVTAGVVVFNDSGKSDGA